jgi:dTMP kinase
MARNLTAGCGYSGSENVPLEPGDQIKLKMFITLEGSEGSGKTSQVQPLVDLLRQQGYDVLSTREPGGTAIGEQIRAVLLNPENTEMQEHSEILLFQAARAQLVAEVIRPHLKKGGVVVSDRYADSTLAYQGYGYQLDMKKIKAIVDFATGGLKPDLTFFFDIDIELGLRRKARGLDEWNRLDDMTLDFYRRVRQGYLKLIEEEPQRWVLIDAQLPPDQVQKAVQDAVLARLALISKQR